MGLGGGLPRPRRPEEEIAWPACIPTGAGENEQKPGADSYSRGIYKGGPIWTAGACRARWSRRRESNPRSRRHTEKDDMNIGGVDVSEQQQKGDFCVCRASAPTALLRREWGGGWGMPASPVGVGRAQPESNRRFPAVRQGVLPLNYAPAVGRRKGGDLLPMRWGVPTFESSAQSVLSAISTRRHRCQTRRFHS